MKESMYMDATNSEIRTQFLEYINTEPDEQGLVRTHHTNVCIDSHNPRYLHFESIYCDMIVKVTCEVLNIDGIDRWYGEVVIQNDRFDPISIVRLEKQELNIGNTILALMIVGVINPNKRRLVCFDDFKLKINASNILDPTITVRTIATRKDLAFVNIKSLIESKEPKDVVIKHRNKLTKSQIEKIFDWSKQKFGTYDITNAEVALYMWDDWCYDKIKKGRLIPNEIS